jgi:hypothetical protein
MQKQNNNKKGFSGLSNLSSNIDDLLENNKESRQSYIPTGQQNRINNNQNGKSMGLLVWFWMLILVIWIAILVIAFFKTTNTTSYNLSNELNTQSEQITPKSDSYITQNRVLPNDYQEAALSKKNSYVIQNDNYLDNYYESRPNKYTQTLSRNELLYCMAEAIRIDAVSYKIDSYSKSEVDRYNLLISDYNDICYSKQYYEKDKNYAQKQIDKKRKELEQEGIARFAKDTKVVADTQIYSLTIGVTPRDATVKILNIKPKYYDGIKLERGDYHIRITKDGYKPVSRWINIKQDEYINIVLKKNIEVAAVQKSSPIKIQSTQISDSLIKTSKPDMSNLLQSEINAIETTCGWKKTTSGPASYYNCIKEQMNALRGIYR